MLVQIKGHPWNSWALEADDDRDQNSTWGWSHQRVVLVALGEVTIYLDKWCWQHVRGGVEAFVVPHPPPQVIDIEGATG